MNPRTKLLVALAVILALTATAGLTGLRPTLLARLALAAAASATVAWWWLRSRGQAPDTEKPRLTVVARTGLSQRTTAALVEVDGQALLVVHGDGFAEIHPTRRRSKRAVVGAAS